MTKPINPIPAKPDVARIATALERIASVLEDINEHGLRLARLGPMGDIGLCVVRVGPGSDDFALRIDAGTTS